MARGEIPPATLEGWYVLHQLFRVDWNGLRRLNEAEREAVTEEFAELMQEWEKPDDGGWSAAYRMVAGHVDLLLLHLRPDIEGLTRAKRRLQWSELGEHLELAMDYLSVVELGLYALTAELAATFETDGTDPDPEGWATALERELAAQRELSYVQRRLAPVQPDHMPYICFYPMDKRREAGQNWYTLPLRERSELMHEHGTVGRRFADRISQIISGSVGLDDWEWAVTLFGCDPLDFKDVVTEMRYDRASALYAEFGAFYVGKRMSPAEGRRMETW